MMLIRKFVVPLQNEALCNSQMNGWKCLMKKKSFWNQLEITIGHSQADTPSCYGMHKSCSTIWFDSLTSKVIKRNNALYYSLI